MCVGQTWLTAGVATAIKGMERSKLVAYVKLMAFFAASSELSIDVVNDFITVCVYVKSGRTKRAGPARVSSRVALPSQKPRCIPHCPAVQR